MLKDHIVTVEQGILQGVEQDGISVFKGVPFAKPPVGELRWRAPQKSDKWFGIRPVTQFQAMPRQQHWDPSQMEFYQSEDCLYLNVWTPADTTEDNLPVYVWYYGGSYQGGNAADPTFDGTNFAKLGVITVTVNYRVGMFGYLCHPDMEKQGIYEHGNFGVMDQIAALQWVHDNIKAFGGNPDKITIGGQSAGSASVNNLMVSPLSRDLIAGCIDQSGDNFQPERDITFEQACANGLKLQKLLGCTCLEEMRRIPTEELMAPGFDIGISNGIICTPVVDGYIFPYAQGEMELKNEASQIPVMIGTCADEGNPGPGDYRHRILERFGLPEEMYPDDSKETIMRLARDYWYGRHLAWARIRANEFHLPTYQYNFTRVIDEHGAQHGFELPYCFGTMDYGRLAHTDKYTAEDYRLSEIMSQYWANFIKTGNPNGEGLPYWPLKSEEPVHLRLDTVVEMEPDHFRPECDIVCPPVEEWMRKRMHTPIE